MKFLDWIKKGIPIREEEEQDEEKIKIELFKRDVLKAINSYNANLSDAQEFEKHEVLEILERFKIDLKKELGLA